MRYPIMNKILYICLLSLFACGGQPDHRDNNMPPVKNGNVTISYLSAGNGDTAVVLVHGWCINKEYWKTQQDLLSNRYRVVALDLGGHGHSGNNRSDWSVEEYARDVIALIDTLQLKKVILVGHSMGGDIVLQVTHEIPEKIIGLIGIDNFKDIALSYTAEDEKSIDEFSRSLKANYRTAAAAFTRKFLFPPNYADTASVNRVVRDVQNMDSVVSIQTMDSLPKFGLKEASLLSQLKIPLRLIVSDYTPMNEAAVKKYCPRGLFVRTIHGTGHYPMIEKPGQFNQLLEETIQGITP